MAGRTQGNYVRVLYDYKYDSNGKHIVIKEGDKCLLLKKTNSEWWSVIKQGEKKPIYVPANYVVELSEGKKGGKGGLRRHGGSVEDIADDEKSRSSSEDLLQTDDAFHNGSCDTSEHDSDSVRNKLTASEDSLDKIVDVDGGEGDGGTHDGGGGGGSRVQNMVDKYEAPEYANLETIRQAAKKAKQDAEPEYANIAHIQAALRSAAPRPSMSCIPVRQYRCAAGKDWDMYTDAETGRSYYHNVATGESTWKPPRGLRTKDSGSPIPSPVPPPTPSPKPPAPAVPEKPPPSPGRGRLKSFNSFGTAVVLGTGSDGEEPSESTTETKAKAHSLPRLSQVPKGWSEEKTEDGVTTYYNQVTSEKYLSSVDDSGRVYFYKKDQSESTWVLPQSPSAVHEEDKRDDLRSPKLKPVDLPSVPDLVLLTTSEAASGPASPAESPLSPSFQANSTPTESPSGSLKRHAQGERRDTLNRTKVTENGKKVKKNWCPSYVVVQGSTLYFYKDHKAATPKASSRSGRPDEVIDLHGATIETNMKEKTSRKNSIVITLLSGTQWLLQADDAQKIQNWYGTLAHNLAQMPQLIVSRGSQDSLDVSSDSLEQLDDDGSPQTAAQMKRKKSRKVSKEADKGGACTLTDREKTSTLEDLPFPEKSSKIKDRLKNFFGQRPEKKTLQAKGIIKETVFGANLQHLAEREKTPVPKYLVQAITEIEEKGLAVDGIYRVSGNLSQIMKLRHMVDQNEKYNFDNPDWDIHVLTGALKLFFRELMEPLFPFKQFSMLLNAIKLQSRSDKVRAFKDAIKTLPRANRETIKYLFRHLNKVIEHSRENRMQTQNVAIVFGPTLMWPEEETQNVTVTTVYQSQIVEFILLEYKHIF